MVQFGFYTKEIIGTDCTATTRTCRWDVANIMIVLLFPSILSFESDQKKNFWMQRSAVTINLMKVLKLKAEMISMFLVLVDFKYEIDYSR